MFEPRIRLVYLCPLFFLGTICLFQFFWLSPSNHNHDPSLHKLAYRLHDAGLRFRAVSPRHDGLVTNAIYLTQTDLDDKSIRSLVLDPSQLQRWHGTVKVFFEADPQFSLHMDEDWGDCAFRYGPFVFFGDRTLLDEIARKIDVGNFQAAKASPQPRPVFHSE